MCTRAMKLWILTLTVCLGVVYTAPMAMQNIQITLNNSGLVWQDLDSMPLYPGYQGKVWECGRGWTLQSWKKFTLYSEGQVAKGDCKTDFVVPRSERCEDKVCVDPKELRIDRSGITVMFENLYKNKTTILTHANKVMQETCFPGNKLMFKVTTEKSISLPSNDFSFKFVVYASCPGIPKDVVMESDKDSEDFSKQAALEEAWTKNLILGIVTAACICVVFLIILLVVYCYFRSNPDIKRRHYTEETKPLRK